jgi:hypothetical protein
MPAAITRANASSRLLPAAFFRPVAAPSRRRPGKELTTNRLQRQLVAIAGTVASITDVRTGRNRVKNSEGLPELTGTRRRSELWRGRHRHDPSAIALATAEAGTCRAVALAKAEGVWVFSET